MTVTTFLDASDDLPEEPDLPEDLSDEEVETEAAELVVVASVALDSERTAFPPPFLSLDLLVVVSAADEVVVEESFPPLPPFPLFPVELEMEAVVAEAPDAAVEELSFASDAALLSATSGPAATALAARAAAASPPEPSLAAVLIVVPEPMTVNLVQSSDVPRWATGIKTG